MGETIMLGFDKPKRKSFFSILPKSDFKKSGLTAKAYADKKRAKFKKEKPTQLKVLKAANVLGVGALGVLVAGSPLAPIISKAVIPKTIPQAVAGLTGIGILTTSKRARDLVAGTIKDPTKLGRGAGDIIEKVLDKDTEGLTVIDALKAGGVIGAGALVVGGAVVAGKKFLDKRKTQSSPTDTPLSAALPRASMPLSQLQATGSPAEVILQPKEPHTSAPSVVVNNNIKINNKSSANRRFINNVHV